MVCHMDNMAFENIRAVSNFEFLDFDCDGFAIFS